jgi:hypothetical protein
MKKFLIIFCFLPACAHYGGYGDQGRGEFQHAMDTWMGASELSVVESWGIPSKEYALPTGEKIFEYAINGGTNISSFSIQNSAYTYVTHHGCKITFILNSNPLKVERIKWAGNSCY